MMRSVELSIDPFFWLARSGSEDETQLQPVRTALAQLHSFTAHYRSGFRKWIGDQHLISRIMTRNRKREVLRGEMVHRHAHTVRVQLTAAERSFHREVSDFIRKAYARLASNYALGLVLTTFRKLLVSSPPALAASLSRRADRIQEALQHANSVSATLSDQELEELSETLESAHDLDGLLGLTQGLSREQLDEEIETLRDLSARARQLADSHDSKAHQLLAAVESVLENDSSEKVLIFTQFRETQSYLDRLFRARGYRVALFHGDSGSGGYSKREEFRRFKQDPGVPIMISTRVGGEGLNLQFCHIMFNYDLPWNPMRIEQRIGRLDRIGQTRDVQIFNFLLEGTLDARILTVLQDRIRLFEETIGNLDPILGDDIQGDIERLVLADDREEAEREIAEWEAEIEKRVEQARDADRKMADFIMDERSFRRDTVDELLGRDLPASNEDIQALTLAFLRRYPECVVESRPDDVCKIRIPIAFKDDCKTLYDVNLKYDYAGTFDPATAIANETIEFFAFGHPLVDAIVRFCTDDEMKNRFDARNALRVLHNDDHAGFQGMQFNYILQFDGVRTYKKLVPVVVDLAGEYDEPLSELVFSLASEEQNVDTHRVQLSHRELRDLAMRSEDLIHEIATRELQRARERNQKDYANGEEKIERLFTYRRDSQMLELERRESQLEELRGRAEEGVIRMWEGQVKATKRRIAELERQRQQDLDALSLKQEPALSYKRLNVAYVKILSADSPRIA